MITEEPPYSLYIAEIDERDEKSETFDFMDTAAVAGVAMRSKRIGVICVFDAGLHNKYLGTRYSFLVGNKLHPYQFSELVARIFYDVTVLTSEAKKIVYFWNEAFNAVLAQVQTNRAEDPFCQELDDPNRLAKMLGFFLHLSPQQLLLPNGHTASFLYRSDGSFSTYAMTNDEITTARSDPNAVVLGQPNSAIRRQMLEDSWHARRNKMDESHE